MAERILVVDDDATIRETVSEVLGRRGFDVIPAESGENALAAARQHRFDLLLIDLRLPDMDGLEVMRRLRADDDRALAVIMTAYPDVRTAIQALKAGAYDYLNKPFDLDDLKGLVQRALETQALRTEVERLKACAKPVEGLIGDSPEFRAMLEMTRRIAAASRTPVLIRGESGTGKERIAQAIHGFSPRAQGPWIAVNCSAISEGLLESEMFGHEKGAFTDARERRRGLFELADGGTLFLDEIGDLSPTLQPKLLRALETQSFRRVGGQAEIKVEVRIVAATNRDLASMIGKGLFREDLYYRLNVAGIDVPPLRRRTEDIIPLAMHFLDQGAAVMGLPRPAIDPAATRLLQGYAWPGNIRELRNVMERAIILAGGDPIAPTHLPKELLANHGDDAPPPSVGPAPSEPVSLAEAERRHILSVVEACRGNKTLAAKRLGISRLTLRTRLRQYGLDDEAEDR
jgi:DNA-binding NtrC family response regulator